jgi:hypothetical protein
MGIRKIGTSNICISLIPAINGEASPMRIRFAMVRLIP